MNVQLSGLGIELNDSLREFVDAHIVDPLRRVYDRSGPILEIELSDNNGPKGGLDKRCRITFMMPHTKSLTVIEEDSDIYRAIDLASQRFRRLVSKYKGWKLMKSRYPKKYFAAKMEHLMQPGEISTPEDITQEEDSLAAAEERERLERNPPPGYAGEPSEEASPAF